MVTLATVPFSSVTVTLPSAALRVQLAATHGVHDMLAAIGFNHADDIGGGSALAGITWQARMVEEHFLVLGLEQGVDGAFRQGYRTLR